MESLAGLICACDEILDTQRKRHILGGVLISISALFAGLAATVITIGKEEDGHYE